MNFLLDVFWIIIAKLIVLIGTTAWWFYEHRTDWFVPTYEKCTATIVIVGIAYILYNFPNS